MFLVEFRYVILKWLGSHCTPLLVLMNSLGLYNALMMHVTDNDDMPHGRYCFCHFGFVLIHHIALDGCVRCAFYAIICVAIFKIGLHQHTTSLALSHLPRLRATFTQSHQLVEMRFGCSLLKTDCWNAAHLHIELSLNTRTHTLFDINTKIETSIPLECLSMRNLQHLLYCTANSVFFLPLSDLNN